MALGWYSTYRSAVIIRCSNTSLRGINRPSELGRNLCSKASMPSSTRLPVSELDCCHQILLLCVARTLRQRMVKTAAFEGLRRQQRRGFVVAVCHNCEAVVKVQYGPVKAGNIAGLLPSPLQPSRGRVGLGENCEIETVGRGSSGCAGLVAVSPPATSRAFFIFSS
ncbi:hypothetical protein K432DRAFT_457981 [Lepidopterella palustris CBS 459.81]|uniref:Uncharacterized protein n=1 Tax=Lepidopterella palustris CBS 459.81 TaxID=1314670 RepID=A0A8E2EIS7_9PEZI|nr:hypothetical protein K432DRAFT_457981 [Lepidopterella palustris CBS 459.81]